MTNPPRSKTAVVIRHVVFEDLGYFAPVLTKAGYDIHFIDLDQAPLSTIAPEQPDLLIVLGGPVGVYEAEAYPYLLEERRILAARLAANRPTFGICLGAQLIAATLGADVAPMGHKEIGFGPLTLTDAGRRGPLRHLDGVPVLHWHGDAFQIPAGAENLAATALCATQGFAIGRTVLGLQFHPEVEVDRGIERWLTGHAAELSAAGIDPRALRAQAMSIPREAHLAAQRMFEEWLSQIG